MKNLKFPALMMLGSLFCSHASAGINVDGKIDVGEWLVSTSTLKAVAGVESTIEEWNPNINPNGYLTPGYGGQAYDAEALYAKIEGGKLFIALITGHDPGTVTAGGSYGAGDFALDFGKDGSYEAGVNFRNMASTSAKDSFGDHAGFYRNATWDLGLWDRDGKEARVSKKAPDSQHPTSLNGGEIIGGLNDGVEFVYTSGSNWKKGYGQYQNDKHYFYEMSIDTSLLTEAGWDGKAFNIHWTENCANDSIIVDPPSAVPEPGSLALLGIGLFGVIGMRRRKQNG